MVATAAFLVAELYIILLTLLQGHFPAAMVRAELVSLFVAGHFADLLQVGRFIIGTYPQLCRVICRQIKGISAALRSHQQGRETKTEIILTGGAFVYSFLDENGISGALGAYVCQI